MDSETRAKWAPWVKSALGMGLVFIVMVIGQIYVAPIVEAQHNTEAVEQ